MSQVSGSRPRGEPACGSITAPCLQLPPLKFSVLSLFILAIDDSNNLFYGINFASADYLGLAQNEFAI
jgi:glycine C-acetyltransferase